MNRLIGELLRRHVLRVAAAYLITGWLIMQIVSVMTPALNLPDWVDGFFAVLLIAGFPLALLLAWAFEMTPEGVKLTAAVPDGESIAPNTGRKLDFAIVAALAVMIAFIAWQQLAPRDAAPASTAAANAADASVAVLPFIDLSAAGDQEYFSDGISEEILNVLVRIPGLGVAGRTSSFAFKGRNEDLREIGEALGVNHVLEGSVRRSGSRLRITAQLIRSSDGFHIWSETYDREIADIFDIQDEIAGAVAGELAISLGIDWQPQAHDRTSDIEAYELYLQARQLYFRRGQRNIETAALLLHEVVARDPDYAPGWIALAGVYSVYESYQPRAAVDDFPYWRRIGLAAAQRAAALDPRSGEAQAYIGVFLTLRHDWVASYQAFDRAVELEPHNAAVLDIFAQNLIDTGYFVDARELAVRAVTLDPLVPIYHNTLGWASMEHPDYGGDTALEEFRLARALGPDLPFSYNNAVRALFSRGRREETGQVFEDILRQGIYPEAAREPIDRLMEAWAAGDTALRALAEDSTFWRSGIADLLEDMEMALDIAEANWSTEPRSSLALFLGLEANYRNHPRWRQHIRDLGLLELWQVRGFPEGCQALGTDDFQCEALPIR
ncbi:tetratricopeptide repeat protein [Maricaulis sp.]|uniref:tetratricopeptide repeat protein n=1 Tax=Maricaulis sp. TaxID=1486257 RepID=UPI003A8F4CFB